MEWNLRTPTLWEWDSLAVFSGKVCETPKQAQLPQWGFTGDVGVDNASIYSSGGGGYSGSDFANGSSSKSSVSASVDSSSKPGDIITEFNLPNGDCAKELGNNELNKVEDSGTSDRMASGGCGEPLIGLKLGKRTYFKDVCAGTSTNTSAFCKNSTSATSSVKKTRASSQSIQSACCQVEGCNIDLTAAKDYHRRHRVCECHSKCPRVVVAGLERRFCQQCSRFHDLSEFDEKKRSCRRRLSDHNARRRKPQRDGVSFSASGFSLPIYDHGQQLNFALARAPVHTRSTSNSLWEDSCAFRLSQPKESWMRAAKLDVDGQIFLPNAELPNSISTLRHDYDRFLLKGNTAEILNQGLEASMRVSNLEATMDLRRALSLLSTTNSWEQTDPGISPSDQLAHATVSQPVMHVHQGLLLSGSEQWQTQHRSSAESGVSPSALHENVGQLQEFQLFGTAYESTFSNHIS